ncbi:hypothetical protein KCTC52924_00508 [Arenibacter antarcticus]|nr:acyltransferase [Arenibacter sp. H213]
MNITLAEYIKRRNGVSAGKPKSLRNNLYRSLGAKNFSTFWNYWNPIFGYYLGKYIFKPLRKTFPVSISLVFTFIFCGLIHDTVTSIFRSNISLFFTTWFLYMGFAVLLTRMLKHNFLKQIWMVRTLINLSIISVCLALAIYSKYLILFYF